MACEKRGQGDVDYMSAHLKQKELFFLWGRIDTHTEDMKENRSMSLLLQSKDVFGKITDTWRTDGQNKRMMGKIKMNPTQILLRSGYTDCDFRSWFKPSDNI